MESVERVGEWMKMGGGGGRVCSMNLQSKFNRPRLVNVSNHILKENVNIRFSWTM